MVYVPRWDRYVRARVGPTNSLTARLARLLSVGDDQIVMKRGRSDVTVSERLSVIQKEIDLTVLDITSQWAEIDERGRQAGRYVPWLYLFLAALAGFYFSESSNVAQVVIEQPYLLALLSLVLLWFPINVAVIWNDVLNCETFLKARSYPRLATLLEAQRSLTGLTDDQQLPTIDPVWAVFDWKPFWYQSTMVEKRGKMPVFLWQVKDLAPHLPSAVLAVVATIFAIKAEPAALAVTLVLVMIYIAIHVGAVVVARWIGRMLYAVSVPDSSSGSSS